MRAAIERLFERWNGAALALTLIVGYVYVQALRAFARNILMPLFQRDVEGIGAGLPQYPPAYSFSLRDRVFFYGDVLEWALTLGFLALTIWLLARRLEGSRRHAAPEVDTREPGD